MSSDGQLTLGLRAPSDVASVKDYPELHAERCEHLADRKMQIMGVRNTPGLVPCLDEGKTSVGR